MDAVTPRPFLAEQPLRRSRTDATDGIVPRGFLLGQGNPALEVLLFDLEGPPRTPWLRQAWRDRQRGRAAPLLVVALHGEDATLCGPAGLDPRIFVMQAAQAERLCARALAEPDRNFALRYLRDALPATQTDTALPGFRNEGLLTDHVLREHAASADDIARGRAALGAEDDALLRRLGFGVERLGDGVTHVLRAGAQKRAVAVLLQADELEEQAAERFQRASPIAWALDRADREGLPWVVMVQRDRVRLYPRDIGIGVGRRGRTETWIEVRTDLIREEQVALLWLVFSADALAAGGTVEALLDASKRFAALLAERLRERIYDDVVPRLAAGISAARGVAVPDVGALRLTYSMALTLLFRLLFLAYAEDRDLLPYAANDAYRARALKTRARELFARDAAPGTGTRHWDEIALLCRAVSEGDTTLGVPAYGGGLFETDAVISPPGAALAAITLRDDVFEPALRALLLDASRDLGAPSAGPVDFRSLRVREFGTIYEGLLESELAVAGDDLALRRQGKADVYVPARAGEHVAVPVGGVYLHNRSGARKSSGSYFTPGFAVDHLLDAALGPALAAHLARLAALDDADAAAAFFDFRVADIAMGSGHFLVAAIDRIERALSAFLVARPLAGVRTELALLRATALGALGELAAGVAIDDDKLLRRQIALRCIYGVDLNPLAVDLARLSVWVHSFVPGLPLALLEDHLVHGNALVGIATVRQIEARFAEAGMALFPVDARALLGDAAEPLRRRAALANLTPRDVRDARDAAREARAALSTTQALCDLIVAQQIAPKRVPFQFERWPELRAGIAEHPSLAAARAVLDGLDLLHFPVVFPEVFLRERAGFDAVLGNPPWEKVKLEEHEFWARHFPGLRGLAAKNREALLARLPDERPDLVRERDVEVATVQRMRAVLGSGLFPGMGTGDPDLYKAFGWRFWHLVVEADGCAGVVLPRSVVAALGSEALRRTLFAGAAVSVTIITNRNGWMFEEVHPQFTVALLAFRRAADPSIALRGPFASAASLAAGLARPPQRFAPAAVLEWTASASLPSLPSEASLGVFLRLREAPRLDARVPGGWRARPDTELHATGDKALMDFAPRSTEGLWPVMKGESFDIWENDLGGASYYAWVKPERIVTRLVGKRRRSDAGDDAVFPQAGLPVRPRIAFRDVSRATDTRTLRAALLPPRIFCAHQAPVFRWSAGDERDEAFLLGVLSSVPLDWYARRFVENHLTYFILNAFPIPRPPRTDPHWQRAVALAGRLAAPDDRFAEWAASVGVAYGPLDPLDKQRMIEELDAVVARLYRLDAAMLAHVFDTFHDWPKPEQAREWAARRDRTLAILETLG